MSLDPNIQFLAQFFVPVSKLLLVKVVKSLSILVKDTKIIG